MITEETLQDFVCSFSDSETHYLIDPILLTNCGHSICKNCLPNETINSIKCKKCGTKTEQDFSKIQVSKALQEALKFFLENIFEIIERKTISKLNEFKKNSRNQEEFLDTKMKYIEEEIDIRVESIKIEVEEVGEKLKEKLKEMKKDILKLDDDNVETKIKSFDLELEILQNSIREKENLNEEFLDEIQKNLKRLSHFITEYNSSCRLPEIKVSNSKFSDNLIGKIYLGTTVNEIDVIELLKNGNKEAFDISVKPCEMVVFQDNQILSTNHDEKCLTLFDHNLNLVRRIDRINGEIFHPLGIAVNLEQKKIYISDNYNHRVMMTDLDFNLIKSIGSKGTEKNKFLGPYDICLISNNLYICDFNNNRIQIYSQNLEFVKSIKLDYQPWKIKATDSIICIESNSPCGINFYNLNDFTLLQNYDHGLCRISQVNSNLYEYCSNTKTIYCYDNRANVIDEIALNITNDSLTGVWDGLFIQFNGSILMTSDSKKKCIKFSML